LKPLHELVAASDHVLVGKIMKVETVSEKKAGGNLVHFHVVLAKAGVLKSSKPDFPERLVLPYSQGHYPVHKIRAESEGKECVFLLKGDDFAPVCPWLFARPIAERSEIEQLIQADGNRKDAAPKPVSKTVSGLLKHYPSVKSVESWLGHNYMVNDTPVLPSEAVPETTLRKLAGKKVTVTGTWEPGRRWTPSAEEKNEAAPVFPDNQVVIRGDGLRAATIKVEDQ
jgi:hypothetical protein